MEKQFTEFTQATNKFAINLYLALRSTSENIVVSPISLQILLAMLQHGAKGSTEAEIEKILHHIKDKSVLEEYKSQVAGLQDPFLKLATALYIEKTFDINSDFKNVTSNYFSAEANPMNFKSNPGGSRKSINDWVALNTNNKIVDLLSEGMVDENTALVLISAIYFKANWARKFDENLTVNLPFYVTPENSQKVKMMQLREVKLDYADSEKLNAQLVRLPYAGNEFSMVIILPNKKFSLFEVEAKLTTLDLVEEFSSFRNTKVILQLPKFKIEQCMELNDILSGMGMPTAFRDGADFTGIANCSLKISKSVQKAFIEVNEEGTEASAATGMVMMLRNLIVYPEIICNHPFMFMILKSSKVIFLGRMCDPGGLQ